MTLLILKRNFHLGIKFTILYTHTHAHLYVKHEYEIIITGIISPHETYIILTGDEKNIRIYTYTSYAIGNSRELLQTAQRIV